MAEQEQAAERTLAISKIYVKDFSFESPQTPLVFKSGEWKPKTNLNLRSAHSSVEENVHEVVLTITVEAK
jgi:preprotein translocase subunit SecB